MKKFLLDVTCINTRHYALTYEVEAESAEEAEKIFRDDIPINEDLCDEDIDFEVLNVEEVKE